MYKKDDASVLNPKQTATLGAIVITTSALFAGLLFREYQSLYKYMGYIAENGKSALFHKYKRHQYD